MQVIKQKIPQGTKLYTNLARACHYQQRRPSGVQAVINSATGKADRFAALPAKGEGVDIVWMY